MRILFNNRTPNPHLECDCGNWIELRFKDSVTAVIGGYTYNIWKCYACGRTYRQEATDTLDISIHVAEAKANKLGA